jgi:hypothetical protein
MRNRHRLRMKIAMSVLVTLVGLLSFADVLPHTDDGCAVEIHCLACRAHINTVADVVVASTPSFGAFDFTAAGFAEEQTVLDEPVRLLPPGRAPPASL